MNRLSERLARGEVVLLDGAISTEIQRQGVALDAVSWSGRAILDSPDIVRSVHADYLRAGADVITANTFATAPFVLAAAGRGEQAREINRRAVELARQAREAVADRPVWIAGSLSSMPPLSETGTTPQGAGAAAGYREQAEVLAEAGVDLMLSEMMIDAGNARIVAEAALATGLPLWHGFSAELARGGARVRPWREDLYQDTPLDDFGALVAATVELGGAAAGIMHSYPEAIAPALEIVRAHWSGPLMAYAETGRLESPDWVFEQIVAPDAYAALARGWVERRGVQIVGGCCGTSPDHIRALKQTLPARIAGA